MNHVYRRIWSTARQCWVVASELSQARGKRSQTLRAGAAAAVLLASPMGAMAADADDLEWWEAQTLSAFSRSAPAAARAATSRAELVAAVVTATGRIVLEGSNSMVLGTGITVRGAQSIGQGVDVSVYGDGQVGMGYGVNMLGSYSVAIGKSSATDGIGSVALGNDAKARANNSIAVGSGAYTHHANAVALGANSMTAGDNTVSVGTYQNRRKIQHVADGDVNANSSDAVTGRQLHATDQKAERALARAQNNDLIASGTAVNTSNKAVASGTGALAVGVGSKATENETIALGYQTQATGSAAIATGVQAVASGRQSIALGDNANAGGYSGYAIGTRAVAAAEGAIALGHEAQVSPAAARSGIAIGEKAKANHAGAIALGANSVTAGANTVSVGNTNSKRKIQYVADGAVGAGSSDAVTGNQLHATNSNVSKAQTRADQAYTLGTTVKTTADNALAKATVVSGLVGQTSASSTVRIGGENTGTTLDVRNKNGSMRKVSGLSDATLSTTSNEAVTGRQLTATNSNVSKAQTRADQAHTVGTTANTRANDAHALATTGKTTADNALAKATVVSGLISQTSASSTVRIGGNNTGTTLDVSNKNGSTRKVSGLSDATLSTSSNEAVTGRQLNTTNSNVSKAQTTAERAGTAATAAQNRADAAHVLGTTANTRANDAHVLATTVSGLIGQVRADGDVRIGGQNTGTTLDVRNKADGTRKVSGLTDATLSTASNEAVTGRQLHATNSNVSKAQTTAETAGTTATAAHNRADAAHALGTTANTRANDAHALATVVSGLVGQRSADGDVRIGGENTGTTLDVRNKADGTRKVSGLTDATLSTTSNEAVTGRQLHATNSNVSKAQTTAETAGTTATAAQNRADAAHVVGTTANTRANDAHALATTVKTTADDAQVKADRANSLIGQTATDGVLRLGAGNTGSELDLRNGSGGNRVVTGAADGLVAAGSSQLVTGSQLYAANQRVDRLEGLGRFLSISTTADSLPARAGGEGSVALGDEAKAEYKGGLALGTFAVAGGKFSTAVGNMAHVVRGADYGFALGREAQVEIAQGVALGAGAVVQHKAFNSVALGHGSNVMVANEVSVGSDAVKRTISNVASGKHDHHASTVGQLRGAVSALGGGAGVDGDGNVVAPAYVLADGTHATVGDALTALDTRQLTTAARVADVEGTLQRVFREEPATAPGGTSQLLLGGASNVPMVLGNVAGGLIAAGSLEAINGGQLHAVKTELDGRIDGLAQRVNGARGIAQVTGEEATSTTDAAAEDQWVAKASEAKADDTDATASTATAKAQPAAAPEARDTPEAPVAQVDTRALDEAIQRVNERTDQALAGMERRLDRMDKRFNRMAAMSSAQAAMAMNTAGLKTYNRLGAGVGHSEGESALSVGYQRVLNEQGSATFSLNGAFTNSGERSIGVGMGVGW